MFGYRGDLGDYLGQQPTWDWTAWLSGAPQPRDVAGWFGAPPSQNTNPLSWGDIGGRAFQGLYDQFWPNPWGDFNPYPSNWDWRRPDMIAPEGWGPVF